MDWVSVTEILPPFHQKVLFCGVGAKEQGRMEKIHSVLCGARMYHPAVRGESWEWVCEQWHYIPEQVTHWMPLPEMPKE